MNNTTKTMSTLDRAVLFLGTGMMLAWFLGIGIGGFVVLLAIAAGTLVYQAHTLTIVLSSFVMVPLMLTLLWGALMLAGVIWEKWGVELSVSEQSGPENRCTPVCTFRTSCSSWGILYSRCLARRWQIKGRSYLRARWRPSDLSLERSVVSGDR